jgi:hypothetical protein
MPAARGSTHPFSDGRIRYAIACRIVIFTLVLLLLTTCSSACSQLFVPLLFVKLGVALCWRGLGWAGLAFRIRGHEDYDGRCGEVAVAELGDASSKEEFAWKCRASWQRLVLPNAWAASFHPLPAAV